jgi:predicted CoA-binding protein
MSKMPADVAAFLSGKRFAVAGVSRQPPHPANAIFRKLVTAGYEVIPVNPHSAELEGTVCYADVTAIPGDLDGVIIATPPEASLAVVQHCAAKGVKRVWFHKSLGAGSVSEAAVKEAKTLGLEVIAQGCPLMYVAPVDVGHKCIRWWLETFGRDGA